MKRVFLIGYMGAGKTTLGRILSRRLQLDFIDLDHYIENRYHKTVKAIFEEKGESGFRTIEKNMLHEVGEFDNVVIATGGGTPCFFDNMEYMNRQGAAVYLKTSPEILHRRLKIAKSKRPLLKDKNDEELMSFIVENLAARSPMYEKAVLVFDADKIDTGEELQQSADLLSGMLSRYWSAD